METRRLEYFLAVVRERSFRRAAETLYISQPALSQQIQRLEQEVGAVLINRSVHPFEMTEAGKHLLIRSQRVLEELRDIEDVAAKARMGKVGRLKVGIAPSLMYSAIPGLIRAFRKTHPDVEFSLHREGTETIMELVAQQRFDLGMLFSQPEHAGLRWEKLYEDAFVVVLPADHPLAERSTVSISHLRNEVFLMLTRQGVPDLHDAIIAACATAGFSPRSIETRFQAFHVEGAGYVDQIGLVAAGYGVAVIPGGVATLSLGTIVYRPLVRPTITIPTSLCWSTHSREPTVTNFVEFCRETMRGNGALDRRPLLDVR